MEYSGTAVYYNELVKDARVAALPDGERMYVTGRHTLALSRQGQLIWATPVHGRWIGLDDDFNAYIAGDRERLGQLSRLDVSGAPVWSTRQEYVDEGNLPAWVHSQRMAVSRDGHVAVLWSFTGDIKLGKQTLSTPEYGIDWPLLVVFDPNGNVITLDVFEKDFIKAIAFDRHNNLYIAGTFTERIQLRDLTLVVESSDLNQSESFLASFNIRGALIDVVRLRGEIGKFGPTVVQVATDAADNVYLFGHRGGGKVDFGGGHSVETNNVFLAKYATE